MDLVAIVIYLIGNAFRVFVIYKLMQSLFSGTAARKSEHVKHVACCIYFVIISIEFLYLKCDAIIILASNIICIFLLSLMHIGGFRYKIFYSVGILSVNLICENWTYNFLLSIEAVHILVIGTVISNLLFLIVSIIIQKIIEYKNGEEVTLSETILLMFIPAMSIIISAIILDDCSNEIIITIGGICLLLMNIFTFYLMTHILKIHEEQYKMSMLKHQYEAYENELKLILASTEKTKAMRHDIKNHLLVLKELFDNNRMEELSEYLNKLMSFNESIQRYSKSGNLVIDSLINSKLNIMSEMTDLKPIINIKVATDINVDNTDLSIIIGNLMDNAINALLKCIENKYLKIEIKQNQNIFIMKIENSYEGLIKQKNGKIISYRKNHGIGLQNVRRVVEKYSGEMDIDYQDNIFATKILLYM